MESLCEEGGSNPVPLRLPALSLVFFFLPSLSWLLLFPGKLFACCVWGAWLRLWGKVSSVWCTGGAGGERISRRLPGDPPGATETGCEDPQVPGTLCRCWEGILRRGFGSSEQRSSLRTEQPLSLRLER